MAEFERAAERSSQVPCENSEKTGFQFAKEVRVVRDKVNRRNFSVFIVPVSKP